jgi:crotonobetainyl-CoA:carnitine CoA-transferase CaiB-like acyl-CoA transferase
MRQWCAARTTDEALRDLQAAGLPCGPVHDLQQAIDHPQVAAMRALRQVADFPGMPRPASVPDLPLTLSVSGGGIARRPPLLGEHTDEVLGGLGYSAEEIAALRDDQVI